MGDEETEGRPRQKRETKPSKFVCKLLYLPIYSILIFNRCSTKPTDLPRHLPQCRSNDVCRKSGKDGDDLPRARRCRRQRQQWACMFFFVSIKIKLLIDIYSTTPTTSLSYGAINNGGPTS